MELEDRKRVACFTERAILFGILIRKLTEGTGKIITCLTTERYKNDLTY